MYIAKYLKQVPPREWCHDALLKDNDDDTVAMYLAK